MYACSTIVTIRYYISVILDGKVIILLTFVMLNIPALLAIVLSGFLQAASVAVWVWM